MPESPEVEALVEWLDARLTGSRVQAVDVIEFRTVKTRARPPATLVGARITGARRFGKHVDLALDAAHLVVSLGRHGWVRWTDAGTELDPAGSADAAPALATVTVDDGTVELTDAGSWVSLGVWVVDDPHEVPGISKLGPDPLDPGFARDDIVTAVAPRRKQLKAILQEQESLAGIGNAYSDEILHRARLSPLVHGDTLTDDELSRLYDAIRSVLTEASGARRGIPIDLLKQAKTDAMVVHGRAGEPCPVCGGLVRDLAFGGTTAQYCPTCQTGGEPVN
jgi:formamidopyrimidine-DNA glycosylase